MAVARRTLGRVSRVSRDGVTRAAPRRLMPRVALSPHLSPAAVAHRWQALPIPRESREALLATGQGVMCVAESAVGVTRMELTATGDLYAAGTLPSMILGAVGGGAELSGQRACLNLMGLSGPGHFASAHRKLARDVRNQEGSHDA